MCALLIAPLPPSSHKQTLISLLQTARQRHQYLCSKQPNTDIAIPPRCRRQTTDCLPALCSHRQTTDCHVCSVQPQTDHRLPRLLCAATDRPQIATPALCSLRQTTDCHACSVQPQTDHRLPFLLCAATERPQAQYRSRVPWRHRPLVKGCACMGLGVWRDGTNCAPLSEVPWCGVMTDS